MKLHRRGMALPFILGLVFCLLLWIGALFKSHRQSAHSMMFQEQKTRAYYMALSGYQHLFFKLRQEGQLVQRLQEPTDEGRRQENRKLLKGFADEVTLELRNSSHYDASYRLLSLELESYARGTGSAELGLQVSMEGKVGSKREVINKLVRIRQN